MKETQQVLKKYKISITKQRLAILSVFLQSHEPQNHSLIEKKTDYTISRYTIYRTLKLFLKKDLLYAVPSEDGIIWYTFQSASQIKNTHCAQLVCRVCGKKYSLSQISFPSIKASKDFVVEAIEINVKGHCGVCK